MSQLGGEAHLDQLVPKVVEIVPDHKAASPAARVRARLQENWAGSAHFKGNDLFENVYGPAARAGVWRLKSDLLAPGNPDSVLDGAEADIEAQEGRATLRVHMRRERSRKLINDFKASLTSFACEACGDDMEAIYGELGLGYVEAHHKVPVALIEEGEATKLSDLAALCANCHRMIHRNGLMSVEALAAHMRARRPPFAIAAEARNGEWLHDPPVQDD
ncbi:HNH endonuclease [Brevundimonas sp. Root608]|uniref:HNH endonuclease n=1 Tax=Brevundimonas sp. Root608 TaxID=1736569 RepID=UPI001910AAF4|nr:HNH endonuclease [Brevundimonas sp. Root608]